VFNLLQFVFLFLCLRWLAAGLAAGEKQNKFSYIYTGILKFKFTFKNNLPASQKV
jgi:hypothetical protein